MAHFGFVRVAAATPALALADPAANVATTLALLEKAATLGAAIVAFPELGLTGYTCHDLFHQSNLLKSAAHALTDLAGRSARIFDGLIVVGVPIVADDHVFNCAAAISRGRILGIVPKTHLANSREFYDGRYFAPAGRARSSAVTLPSGETVPFGPDQLFTAHHVEGLIVGIEICEDVWTPIPPSCRQALAGATVLINLSASNELVGKADYRRELIANQSARCIATYIYSASGVYESTQDLVFGGHSVIAENGVILAEAERFRRDASIICADVDIDRLRSDRWRTNSFGSAPGDVQDRPFRINNFEIELKTPERLLRHVDPHPFVPAADAELNDRCEEIFHIQVGGLARRLEQIGRSAVSIGVSGGLDSTLALLVACKTLDALGAPRSEIRGCTLPGFGTSARTKANAAALMQQLGVTAREIDIRPLCLAEWKALGHAPFGIALGELTVASLTEKLRQLPAEQCHDLVFENVQARVRTNLLMNSGFVVGTGDLSELALGWCTYNADHMSMYGVNVGVPKTLVKFLVQWAAEHEFTEPARKTLLDIAATVISPELLPAGDGTRLQATEESIGPYELHDFFLFHLLRYGAPPGKILYLASHVKFDTAYSAAEIKKWLRVFLQRFFANQFKRSCLPDGPKVGSISLSPRGDWRMPSDAKATAWLAELD